MHFSRREILKGMGAAGVTPLLISACSSSGDSGAVLPPLPEDLPEYQWEGPIGPENLFEHGVASGDPLPEGVILWSRVTPEASEPVEVWWEMALDEDFLERTAQGTFTTDASRDYTVKVDVPGLIWGRNYFYRFALQGRWSPTGRTRLAPKRNEATQLRFGVCSCSNYGFGYFHAYRHMAALAELDAIDHLGDYTYEYQNGEYPTFEDQLRPVQPENETVTLEDYRLRLSLYRRDEDLQECHRQHPFIIVWDDHETANNSWMGGAENHDPEGSEGSWEDRLAEARQAFFEWIPIRENQGRELYRILKYGDLADIIMLDTRIEGREQQFSAIVAPSDAALPDNIISAEQEAWLQDQLANSTAKWKVIGNQVIVSLLQLTNTDGTKTIINTDLWHGYAEGRERLLTFFRTNDISNTVFITGDVHSSWAIDVTFGDGSYDPATRDGAICGEFVAPGITSPGSPALTELADRVGPQIRYVEGERKGYFVLDVQAD
ncbi:MAG: alkaline phosphatase D family protein, partial [Gemmatimonadetes bacterium]|nr:alkaline phosphatase D family protein [Gemmatimonadota bacterium]